MKKTKQQNLNTYASALIALALTISIIRFPEEAFDASLHGLKLWFEVVLPALLPFFAMSDILMGLGVVNFIGVLLEPIMETLFNIPGVGAFGVALGLASGCPTGAKITGQLHRQNLINSVEAERLVSFANTAGPLFMVGAVAIGMFGLPELGITLSLAHYLSVIMVGLIMRFHGRDKDRNSPKKISQSGYFKRALQELVRARRTDGRPFGQLFDDSVRDTFSAMLFVGGSIMMFSVVIRILTVSGLLSWLSRQLGVLLGFTGIAPDIIDTLITGFFEKTNGSEVASLAQAPLIQKAWAASAIIGWSGLSVHAQVAAMLHGTDIRLWPYLIARFLHGIFAAIITVLLMGPVSTVLRQTELPVLTSLPWAQSTFLTRLWASTQWSLAILVGLFILGLVATITQRLVIFRVRCRN